MKAMNMMPEHREALNKTDPLKPVTEKKRKHIRMVPVYVGFPLILIIAGHFFYRGDNTLNLVQTKPSETKASPVYLYPVPPDDTGDQQNVAFQPSETPDPSLPIQGDSFIEESKELVDQEPVIDKAETGIPTEAAPNIGAENFPLLSTNLTDSIIDVEGSVFPAEQKDLKFCKEEAVFKESESVWMEEETGLTERAEAGGTFQAGPWEEKTKSASPPEPGESLLKSKKPIEKKFPNVKETAQIEKEENIIQADTKFSSSRVVTPGKAQTTAPAKKENGPVATVEEEQQPKLLASAVSAQTETPSTPGQQETVGPEDKQALDARVNEDAAIKLQHIDSNVARSTGSAAGSDEKKQPDYTPLTLTRVETTKLNTLQDKTQLDNYTVSLYYTSEKNKELMEYLSILLQLEGFDVLSIEKADYQNNDIRYFHNEDKAGAHLLQKYSTEFISPFMNLEGTDIKIKNLSQKYPNARKGGLEVWLNNNF